MDLSIKSVQNKRQLNFQGVKGDYDSKNKQVFRFSLPSYKPQKETPYLEISLLDYRANAAGTLGSNSFVPTETVLIPFEDKTTIELPQEEFKKAGYSAFAYRYVFEDNNGNRRYALDGFKKERLFGEEKNIIEIGDNFGVTPISGAMRHSFIDSDGIDVSKLSKKDKEFIRTHHNKLGGSVKGLTYLLDNGYFDGFKYIISTPDIGADPTSPHKYWPNNQYQCTNMNDFKEFNFELFKNGKGYVADGAFTSQSLQSPLVAHVLKWGDKSPFYNMLKMEDGINLGIIPENEEAFNHTGVKIINAPNSEHYDKKKPVLMQFYDDRTTSEKQIEDTVHTIDKYDIPNPEDHYDIVSYQDLVHPFYFEIPDDEIDKKLALFEKNENHLLLKDLSDEELDTLLNVGHGNIVNRYNASSATYWDGNVDIIKMNLSNPNKSNKANIEGFFNARKYLYGVATFWSEAIQSDLIFNSAKLSEKEINEIALKNGIMQDEYEAIKENINDKETYLPVLAQNKTVEDYVSEFPLQSIETSPELSAIFSQPQFSEQFLKGKTFDNIVELTKKAIKEITPDKYKDNDEYLTYVTKTCANEIIRHILISAMAPDAINSDGSVDLEKLKNKATLKRMLKLPPISVEDERAQVISRIRKNLNSIDIKNIKNKLRKDLKNISLENFKLADSVVLQGHGGLNWRFDAAKDIADLESIKNSTSTFKDLWSGTVDIPGTQQFWGEFIKRIKTYNPSSYIIAEITNFGDGLYNWNDFDSMMNYDSRVANSYLNKIKDDIDEVENPTSTLSQLANTFCDETLSFDKRREAFRRAMNIMDENRSKYPTYDNYENNLPYAKEQEFLEQIGASTSSNYDKYFNNLSAFVGVDPEHGYDKSYCAGDVRNLKNKTNELIKYSQPNSILMSHVFTDNHDKPRLMHTLPLDMGLYVKSINQDAIINGNSIKNLDRDAKEKIYELTGRGDFENLNSQAVAVGLMMKSKIEEIYVKDKKTQKQLLDALKDLVNGKKGDKFVYRRASAFGTLPYEITVRDLFKKAGIDDEGEIENFIYNIVQEPMDLQDKLWQVMNALTGVPTMYYGTDYAQTGYESASKNLWWGNRDRARHERRDDKLYAPFYNKMHAISSLSLMPNLSALKNGYPELLNITSKDNLDFFPIYRKDERGSEVLSVITNYGIEKNQPSRNHKKTSTRQKTDSIKIANDRYCPFEEGQILKRMVYDESLGKYVSEDVDYEVKGAAITRKDKKDIVIDDSVLTFYVDKQRNPKFVPSYYGAR